MPTSLNINAVQGTNPSDAPAIVREADGHSARVVAMAKANRTAKSETFQKFEAMVLQNFVQSILPEENEAVYGEGMAGDIWKSFLATEIAGQMAKAGGIGIADRVLGDHYMDGDQKVALSGVSHDPAKPDADRQKAMSAAMVQELQRNMARQIGTQLTGDASTGVFNDK